jgi:hypothetical protein
MTGPECTTSRAGLGPRAGRLPGVVDEPTWIVLIRDVSHAVHVDGESCLVASLVLDADAGLVRGMSVDRTGAAILRQTRPYPNAPVTSPAPSASPANNASTASASRCRPGPAAAG